MRSETRRDSEGQLEKKISPRETRVRQHEGGLFLEPLDLSESDPDFCPSIGGIRPLLGKKNVGYVRKLATNPLFPFSCNTRNVVNTTLSTVITDMMGE